MKSTLIIFANDSWYILKFRKHLIEALVPDWRVIVVSGDDDYTAELTAVGAEVRTIPMSPRSISPVKILQACFSFVGLLRRERPAYVLTFNPSAGLIAAIASKAVRTCQIATISGFGKYKFLFTQRPKALKHKILRFVLNRVLVIWPEISVVQNGADFDYAKAARGPARRTVRVMGSGVDLSQFGFVERDFKSLRVLFAARFLLEKGILDYIELARRFEGDWVSFSICGLPVENDDGLDAAQLQTAIQGTDIAYLGEVSDMASLLAETDVVVLPSLYGEGIPRILIEAAARGCLTLAHDIDGVREIVVDGQTGLLARSLDFEGVEAAMARLVEMPRETLSEMSHAGHALAVTQFDIGDVTETYLGLLR